MPLPQQAGVIEGLSVLVKYVPGLFDFSNQQVLAFISDLLKMTSVADGEMTDSALSGVADKNGYVGLGDNNPTLFLPPHSSALFFRRECVVHVDSPGGTLCVHVPEQTPVGVQMRVGTITLLHAMVVADKSTFFESEASTAIGELLI